MDEGISSLSPTNSDQQNYTLFEIWLSRFPILIFGYFVFYLGEFGNLLRDDLDSFWGIILVFILSGIWLFTKNWPVFRLDDRIPIILLIVLFIIYPYLNDWWWWIYYGGGAAPTDSNYQEILDTSLFIVLILVFSYALNDDELDKFARVRYIIILGILFRIKLITILNFPNPSIDVWEALMLGPSYLLQGKNPYAESYSLTNIDRVTFFYPPGLVLIFVPIRFLNLDVRYFFLIIEFVLALLIYLKAGKNRNAELLSLTLLVLPFSYFFLHYALTEPLLALGLAGLIFWGDKPSASKWRPFAFGFLATLKQSMWLLMPFYAVYLLLKGKQGIKEGILCLAMFLVIMLPFYLLSPQDLIDDIWRFPRLQVRYESLTINSYLERENIERLPITWFLIPYTILLLICGIVSRQNQNKSLINMFKFSLVSLFLFFLWGKLAFMNHYYLFIVGFYFLMIKQGSEYSESFSINDDQPKRNASSS